MSSHEKPADRIKKILEEKRVEEEKRSKALTVFAVQGFTPHTASPDQRRQYKRQFDAIDDAERNLNRVRQELSALQLIVMNESIAALNQSVENLKTVTTETSAATKKMSDNTKNLLRSAARTESFTLILVILAAASIYVAASSIISFDSGIVIISAIVALLVIDVVIAYRNREMLKSN